MASAAQTAQPQNPQAQPQTQPATQISPYSGEWLLDPAKDANAAPGTLRMTMHFTKDEPGNHSNWTHTFHVNASDLQGLAPADLNSSGKHETFQLVRDAGSFNEEGWVQDGHGSGHYTFAPNAQFAAELQKRGIGAPTLQMASDFRE